MFCSKFKKQWHDIFLLIYITFKKLIMRVAGIVLLVLGLIGSVVFGIQALNDSESLNVLGVDFAVSSANWTPLIISGIVLLIGLFMSTKRKSA